MDEFDLEHLELTGSLISMEFGQGGRIQQLWVAESATPEGTQEFQFVCPPLDMGEEVTEDYFPGTILLGARTSPDDPWIVSRNATAVRTSDDDASPNIMSFEYEFAFMDELAASARYYEIPGPVPQIAWDVQIRNRARKSVEIGELAFPFGLNNVYEGFARTDQGTRELFHERVYVHKAINGAASYLHCQRLNGRPPGLVIYPGEDTRWEFYNHVPSSLTTPFRWEGIPVVYVHSRAAIEREGWSEWFRGHTSVVLEPGDTRTYHTRFAGAERFQPDPLLATLSAVGRPAISLYPGAVAPVAVGITAEISGTTPTRFMTDAPAEIETEADEEGGSCVVKPAAAGPVRLFFEDTAGRESDANLLFIEPIEHLIQKRAEWIVKHQVVREEGPLFGAIVAGNLQEAQPILDGETYITPFGIGSGLSDALYLAEKNTIYPNREEIRVLNSFVHDFLEQKVLNPGDLSIGSLLPNPNAVAVHTGRAENYTIVYCLYDALARIASGYGETMHTAETYRKKRDGIWLAMLRCCSLEEFNGVPLASYITSERKRAEPVPPDLADTIAFRRKTVAGRRYPFNGDSLWDLGGIDEAYWTAIQQSDSVGTERYLRYAYAARSLSPNWWWYASDKRWSDTPHSLPHPGMSDKGEMCLGPTTTANSLLYFSNLDRDSDRLSPTNLRFSFGGLLGVWALVREDGGAGMGFCPDAASRQFGMSWTTGDVGIGLFHYLRGVASVVLASRAAGLQTFGCHFEQLDKGEGERFRLKPWDGVGRRILIRHLGIEVNVEGSTVSEFDFDVMKRNATMILKNQSDKKLMTTATVQGLWGDRFTVNRVPAQGVDGKLIIRQEIAASSSKRFAIKVVH